MVAQQPSSSAGFAMSAAGASLMEVSAFMTEQLRSQMTEQRAHDNAQQAKLERQREDTEALRQEYEAKLADCEAKLDAKNCVSDTQLEGLQERFDALHQAKLLTDDAMLTLEDKLADFIECRSSVTVADSVRKLVGMCEGVSKDEMFARQLRRKFL